jgi:hypothetical protein
VASSALVGPGGGTLTSADGTVTLEVPAGALAEPTMLSMQPISNTAPLGVRGAAVRLSPSGQRFSVPATLKVALSDGQLAGGEVGALWVLTQTREGAWRARLRRSIDPAAKTISVKLTGFSDWAVGRFVDLTLETSSTVVEPLGSVTVKATGFLPAADPEEDDLAPIVGLGEGDDLLAPIVPVGQPEDELAPISSADQWVRAMQAKQWQLSGEGTLAPDGLRAVYTAPAQVPAQNPVTVSLELAFSNPTNPQPKFLLVTPIRIQQDGVWLEFSGQRYEAPAQFVQVLRGSDRVPALSVTASAAWSLTFDVDRPRQASFTLKRCGPDDEGSSLSFSPMRDFTYDITYWERSNASGVCVVMAGSCMHSGVTLKLDDYAGTSGSVVSGTFEGTLYEDEDRNSRRLGQPCRTSRGFPVRGGFVGRLSVEE